MSETIGPARLVRILELSRNEIYLIDAATLNFLFANNGALSNTGYSQDDMSRLTPLDLKPELPRPVWERLVRPLIDGLRHQTRFDARHRRKDGSFYDVSVRLEYMADEAPAVFVAFIEDMTERVEAETLRARSDALLASVIATAPDAIITIDADARILSFSRAAELMLGYRTAEVIGRNVNILMPEPYRSHHDGYIERYLRTGEKRIIGIGRQVQAQRKNGTVFPMELAVGEVLQNDTHIFTGFIRDVSDRVAMESRSNALQRELNHAARLTAMGEMAAALAHELNQPLSAITNYASVVDKLLAAEDPDRDRVAGFNTKIGEQANRAGEIIRRLREFVRRGETERHLENVNEIVREAVQLAMIGSAGRGVRFAYSLGNALPDVLIDRVQIQQVVVNLVRNAMDAVLEELEKNVAVETHFEEREAVVDVAATFNPAGDVHITVRDTGPGIAPEVLPAMFEPFVTSKSSGMGIGLAVSRSIIEAHGGRIWAENDEAGAAVHFTIPTGSASA